MISNGKNILILLLGFLLPPLKAQKTFQRVLDGKGWAENIIKTSDGGYLIISNGPFISPLSDDAIQGLDAGLIKLDSNFETQWSRHFASNGTSLDRFDQIVDFEGFYYAIGEKDARNNIEKVFVKLDYEGNEIWTKRLFDGSSSLDALNLAVLDDELWIILFKDENGVRLPGYFVLNENSELIEQRIFRMSKNVTFRGIKKYEGYYYLVGTAYKDFSVDQNYILVKLSNDKELLWVKEYESDFLEGGIYRERQTMAFINNYIYFGGRVEGTKSNNGMFESQSILKVDLEGELAKVNEFYKLEGKLNTADESFIVYQEKLYLGFYNNMNRQNFSGIAVLDKDLELLTYKEYQFENFAGTNSLLKLEDGFLMNGNQYTYHPGYEGVFLIKTDFDLNTSCTHFKSELGGGDITAEYVVQDIYFTPFVIGDLALTTWDSTYTLDTKVIHNCEETYFTLHDKTPQSYCKEDEVELTIYGKEGAISWNIAPELILEETDDKIRFIIKEEIVVEATDNSTDKHYSLPISMDCTSGEYPDMRVNETISSNDDGLNDYFTIDNVEFYPENQVLLVDQRGNKVFSTTGYENNWGNKELAQGIYQYIIHRNLSDDHPLRGLLIVKY